MYGDFLNVLLYPRRPCTVSKKSTFTFQHFCSEIYTFYREHGSGLYSVTAYFFAKNLAEVWAASEIRNRSENANDRCSCQTSRCLRSCLPRSCTGCRVWCRCGMRSHSTCSSPSSSRTQPYPSVRSLLWIVLDVTLLLPTGYAAGCIFGSVKTAVAVLPIFVTPMMVFGGLHPYLPSLLFVLDYILKL